MRRITTADLEQYIKVINNATGAAPDSEGYLELGGAYGSYRVESRRGSQNLSPLATKRETYNWLDGYSQAVEHLLRSAPFRGRER